MKLQLGEPLYCVRTLAPRERELFINQVNGKKSRIISQQFADGFPSYRHYGIAMGDGTVIHFTGEYALVHPNAYIQRTPMEYFSKGSSICIATDINKCFPNYEIANRAMGMVGSNFGGYNCAYNNCEHFANWCACGRRISRQVLLRED